MIPFVIAEAGSCHEGSLDKAIELIAVAHSAGANAVKYQYWSRPDRMRARRRVAAPALCAAAARVSGAVPSRNCTRYSSGP